MTRRDSFAAMLGMGVAGTFAYTAVADPLGMEPRFPSSFPRNDVRCPMCGTRELVFVSRIERIDIYLPGRRMIPYWESFCPHCRAVWYTKDWYAEGQGQRMFYIGDAPK